MNSPKYTNTHSFSTTTTYKDKKWTFFQPNVRLQQHQSRRTHLCLVFDYFMVRDSQEFTIVWSGCTISVFFRERLISEQFSDAIFILKYEIWPLRWFPCIVFLLWHSVNSCEIGDFIYFLIWWIRKSQFKRKKCVFLICKLILN